MIYLRATPGSILQGGNTGAFNAAVLSNVTCSGNGGANCSAMLYLAQGDPGPNFTYSASVPALCHNNSSFRAVVHGSQGAIYIDDVLYLLFQPITPSAMSWPGIGLNGGGTNGIASANLGQIDTIAPYPVNPQSVQTSDLPNQIDLHWTPTTDNPGGIGVAYYDIYRNSVFVNHSATADFVDTSVSPGTTYTYWIVPVDYHLNGVTTSVTVSTTPATTIDPREVGVRPMGTYWGGAGEQIDMRSGNLNFTQALLKPMGRGGSGVSFNLSYNSQNWRVGYSMSGTNGMGNGTGPWQLGEDIGYGFGWQLQAGSLTPVYSGYYTIDHYLFIDATGAQYVLDQNNGNVWSSLSGIYVWYDANAQKLHFKDGSFWEFMCQSAGTEQDAGTSYPTLMEDSNGNQINILYNEGVNTTWTNSSSRIQSIADVRAVGYPASTYNFTYNSDAIPHLTAISNNIGTAESYSFSVLKNQALESPFLHGQTSFGTTTLLQSLTQAGTFTTAFTYDVAGSGTSGALTEATFPYGGHLRWAYGEYDYASGQALMEVSGRYLAMSTGSSESSYSMVRQNDTANTTHSAGCTRSRASRWRILMTR